MKMHFAGGRGSKNDTDKNFDSKPAPVIHNAKGDLRTYKRSIIGKNVN